MSEFFKEVVNMSNQQEAERNNKFEAKVNRHLPTVEAKIRKKIKKNTRCRKVWVKEPWNTVKLEAINRVCNKLKEEGFSVMDWQHPYEFLDYRVYTIISW